MNRRSLTENFPKLVIKREEYKEEETSLKGRETVEEFLQRGGVIKKLPNNYSVNHEKEEL